ncbi:MAG TPA: beta-galactosidase [Planctomycetota bacterium]|nr:beta-galactosidase [Planctomycetota bacterium]
MPIRYENGSIEIDGKKHHLFTGEVHYWRLEPRYWRPVLSALKETGMEWVGLYVPWRVHDKGVHQYDFEGKTDERLDLPRFLELIAEMGLMAYFRPGPLIVSEMACGGYPDWLGHAGPEYMVWTATGEVPKGFPGENNPGSCPSYLHPTYLKHCRTYLAAVNRAVAPFLHQNGGPIKLYQLDNEVSLICRNAMFQSDYNPHIVGPGGEYHQWLQAKYGSLEAIAYGDGMRSIEEIAPPRDLNGFGKVPFSWYFDWAEFKEFILAEYIRRLRKIHEDCGVKDVAFCTNLNPHRPDSIPTNWHEETRACTGCNPGIVGYDFYRGPFLSRTGYGSIARISRMLSSYFPLPWSAEFMCGFWFEDYSGGSYPYAEHHEFMADTAIAHGLRGISWYMFHDREYWGGSPVSSKGHRRCAYDALCTIMRFVNGAKDFGSLREEREVGVFTYRPYHRHTFLGDPMPADDSRVNLGPPEIDGIPAGRTSREVEGLYPLLADAGYHPGAIDPDVNPGALKQYRAVFAPTQTFMDDATQRLLLEYVRDGGTLITGPAVPVKDLEMRPAGVLGSVVSATPAGSLGKGTRFPTALGDLAVEGEWYAVSGEPVLCDASGRVLAAQTALGRGRFILLATYFAQSDNPSDLAHNHELCRHLLELAGVKPYARIDVKNVKVVVLAGGGETFVYLLNHDRRAHTVTVTFRDSRAGYLEDIRGGEHVRIAGNAFIADVDVKRARLFRLVET